MTEAEDWFGRYRLIRLISIGGMAEVYQARSYGDHGFEKEVALKRILPSVAADEDALEMFIREAKLAVSLTHPNIGAIYELGKVHEWYYITMEYIYGKNLRQIAVAAAERGQTIPWQVVAAIAIGAASGLYYAHTKRGVDGTPLGIVHRDISPQNIVISYAGEVKIIDFGIAKVANQPNQTQVGIIKGKTGYMAPEQVDGLPLDARTDQFCLGIVLWELLTGKPLFRGGGFAETLDRIRSCIVPPLVESRGDIPGEFADAVHRMLSKDRESRFPDLQTFRFLMETLVRTGENVGGQLALERWMDGLYPDSSEFGPPLDEEVHKLLTAAEHRGEETTDRRWAGEGTQVFIHDTSTSEPYRQQIEALLRRRQERDSCVRPNTEKNLEKSVVPEINREDEAPKIESSPLSGTVVTGPMGRREVYVKDMIWLLAWVLVVCVALSYMLVRV
ncbi:MAG: serine/threonine protein kinase [Myxococcales bacterium]|nr:serine/threonine protein kinase [Myxococcales bacterium]